MEYQLLRWKEKYTSDLQQAANNENIAKWMTDSFPYPYTADDADAFINYALCADDSKEYLRAVVIEGKACGGIGLSVKSDIYGKTAELGYWLAEQYWHLGIMSAAIKEFCLDAFERYDIIRIYALPFADNTASRHVLNSCGFNLEGIMKKNVIKNGIIHDSCIYSLIRD